MDADRHYKILCFPKDVLRALQGSGEVLRYKKESSCL